MSGATAESPRQSGRIILYHAGYLFVFSAGINFIVHGIYLDNLELYDWLCLIFIQGFLSNIAITLGNTAYLMTKEPA